MRDVTGSDNISFDITVDESDSYSFDYRKKVDPYGNVDIDTWGDINVPQDVIAAVDAKFDELTFEYGTSTYLISVSAWWGGYLNAGTTYANDYMYWQVDEVSEHGSGIYPIITWDAETFEEWLNDWPDPTFSGLLPGMTANELFVEIFEMDENDWQQELDD